MIRDKIFYNAENVLNKNKKPARTGTNINIINIYNGGFLCGTEPMEKL